MNATSLFQHGMGQQVWYLRRGATTQYSLRNTYDGELYQGMRHGYGIFHYANGARYEGEWKYNVKSGKVCSLVFHFCSAAVNLL